MPENEAPNPWGENMSRLAQWRSEASIGDGGERPAFSISYDGLWWEVSAHSFYGGYADGCHGRTLEDAAREAVVRLMESPGRQKEAEVELAIRRLAEALDKRTTEIRECLNLPPKEES